MEPINWEAVKMLALVCGVRESARRMGISEEMVKKRCTRERWLADPAAREIARRSVQERSVTVSPHTSPSQVIHQEMMALSAKSKLGLARGLARAAEHVETLDGQEVMIESQNIKSVAQSTALVHGWDKNNLGAGKIRLEVIASPGNAPTYDVESEVVTIQEWDES